MHTYTIVITGMSQYTAYRGNSHTNAQKAIDAARAILAVSQGTAKVFVCYWEGKLHCLWDVTKGSAALENILEVK